MRYVRQALIEACDRALAADKDRAAVKRENCLKEHGDQVAAWSRKYAQEWAAAGLAVRRAVREGRPVTRDMLPMDRRYHDSVATFSPQFNFDRPYEPPQELAFLRRILDVVEDDVVTTTGLEKLGVSVRTMRDAAWYMAVGSARE